MSRLVWPLRQGRPCVQITLSLLPGNQPITRFLLADTGAGSQKCGFELILEEDDCLLCGGIPGSSTQLSGAYLGSFPVYSLRVQLPAIGFNKRVSVVGIPKPPVGFDGIAGFSFLNRFCYGNFGNSSTFGLE